MNLPLGKERDGDQARPRQDILRNLEIVEQELGAADDDDRHQDDDRDLELGAVLAEAERRLPARPTSPPPARCFLLNSGILSPSALSKLSVPPVRNFR